MARFDKNGKRITIGSRLRLYDNSNDSLEYGTGMVVKGNGGVPMISMDIGSSLEGKHKLKDLEKRNISFLVIEEAANNCQFFSKEDLQNWNYLISSGFTGSFEKVIGNRKITITIDPF